MTTPTRATTLAAALRALLADPNDPSAQDTARLELAAYDTAVANVRKGQVKAEKRAKPFTVDGRRFTCANTAFKAARQKGFDGASAVQTHMTNSRLTDPEVLEFRFPVRLESYEIRQGSGGAGRWRGGDGGVRKVRFLEPMTAAILSNNRDYAPFGMAGGAPGATGRNAVQRVDGSVEELAHIAKTQMQPGDIFIIETPGGGGYGRADCETATPPPALSDRPAPT